MTRRPTLTIAVCGGGPAGLAAALLLHRAGHRVTIYDQFDAPGPVGSGLLLQPTGLGVLSELELLPQILKLGAPIHRLFGRAMPSKRIALQVRYDALGSGFSALGIHRAALFGTLHTAVVGAGIHIEPKCRIDSIEQKRNAAALVGAGNRTMGEFDLVVDALGANSTLASHGAKRTVLEYGALWFNAPWPGGVALNEEMLEQRYLNASRMIGVLPIGKMSRDGVRQAACFWSLKRSEVANWRTQGIGAWLEAVERLWPEARPLFECARDLDAVTFAQYDHFTARTPYSQRLAHIGDAAHATSPQLGQGANMGLLDALALSRALSRSATLSDALEDYARMRRWHIRVFQAASAAFTPFYQSDSKLLPLLRDWVTVPLSRLPIGDRIVARLVSGMTMPPLGRSKFTPYRFEKKPPTE